MANPATTLARTGQDERIPGLPVLPIGTDPATLTVPVYNPATDQTHQAPIGGPAPVTNAIIGGAKVVQYVDSRYFGVPTGALTLDRLLPATIVPGNLATVDNPAAAPLTTTEPPRQYVATLVAAGTAGAVLVPRYLGAAATDTVPIVWQEVVAGPGGSVTTLIKATLAKTQALLSASAVPASTFGSQYAITGPWNNPSPAVDSTVYVVALSASAFALLGSVLDSAGAVQTVSVDVAAGTWKAFESGNKPQVLALVDAQQLRLNQPPDPQVKEFAGYAITGPWNTTDPADPAPDTTVYVLGLSATEFASTGWVVDNNQVQAVNLSVGNGTWEPASYTDAQINALLATKQGAVTKEFLFPAYGPGPHTLPRLALSKAVQLLTAVSCVVNLPTPTAADVSSILAIWNNCSSANQLATVQATLGTDAASTYIANTPTGHTLLLQVVEMQRGYPYNDTVYGYTVLANSNRNPAELIYRLAAKADLVNGKVPASQLPPTAPQWLAGQQREGALVYDAGQVYRVRQDIANSQSAPAGNPANYEPVGSSGSGGGGAGSVSAIKQGPTTYQPDNTGLVTLPAASDTVQLNFAFDAGFANDVTRVITASTAGIYAASDFGNIDAASYQLNFAASQSLALNATLTLASGDTIRFDITRNDSAKGSVLQLSR